MEPHWPGGAWATPTGSGSLKVVLTLQSRLSLFVLRFCVLYEEDCHWLAGPQHILGPKIGWECSSLEGVRVWGGEKVSSILE